uniref:Uncharacterized protein n=1 Tax=Rhizophora mucronata TaxID=61149 RepID=A0A2P2Q2E4_RHIMU
MILSSCFQHIMTTPMAGLVELFVPQMLIANGQCSDLLC